MRKKNILVLISCITWKLGGIIILPAGTCRTIFSPSNSQRSHLDWLMSRAQGSSSISRVLTHGLQTDSFTRIGLSHWLSWSFLFQTHPRGSLKHDELRIYEVYLSIPDTQCSRRIPLHTAHPGLHLQAGKSTLRVKTSIRLNQARWHLTLTDACKWSSLRRLSHLA